MAAQMDVVIWQGNSVGGGSNLISLLRHHAGPNPA